MPSGLMEVGHPTASEPPASDEGVASAETMGAVRPVMSGPSEPGTGPRLPRIEEARLESADLAPPKPSGLTEDSLPPCCGETQSGSGGLAPPSPSIPMEDLPRPHAEEA